MADDNGSRLAATRPRPGPRVGAPPRVPQLGVHIGKRDLRRSQHRPGSALRSDAKGPSRKVRRPPKIAAQCREQRALTQSLDAGWIDTCRIVVGIVRHPRERLGGRLEPAGEDQRGTEVRQDRRRHLGVGGAQRGRLVGEQPQRHVRGRERGLRRPGPAGNDQVEQVHGQLAGRPRVRPSRTAAVGPGQDRPGPPRGRHGPWLRRPGRWRPPGRQRSSGSERRLRSVASAGRAIRSRATARSSIT